MTNCDLAAYGDTIYFFMMTGGLGVIVACLLAIVIAHTIKICLEKD